MLVRYQYRCDVEYFKAVIDRQYRQGPWLLRLPIQFGIVGFAGASASVAVTNTSMVARAMSFILIFGLVAAIGVWATKQGLMMKFRSKPGFGSEVAISLSDTGVEVGTNKFQAKLEWSTYPTAIRFADGLLLKRSGSTRWLPDSAICAGNAAEATGLVDSKTSLRYVQSSR